MSESGSLHSGDVVRGLVAGILAGLVASYAMNAFQAAVSRFSEPSEPKRPKRKTQGFDDSDPTNAKAASVLSESVFRHRLSPREKEVADPAVHYTSGQHWAAFTALPPSSSPKSRLERGCRSGRLWPLSSMKASSLPPAYPGNLGNHLLQPTSIPWVRISSSA
jgi:hypothetical protein